MNRSAFVGIAGLIVGGLVVLAYNAFIAPAPPSANPCPGKDPHCIPVYVITVGGKPQIGSIPDNTVIDQGAVITWMIGTPGYTFPANGIEFNNKGDPLPPNEFINCHTAGSMKYVCTDKKNSLGKFAYKVTLDGTPAVPPLDPYIVNQ